MLFKKMLSTTFFAMLLMISSFLQLATAQDISIFMDGKLLEPSIEQGLPYIKNDRLMVPLRFLGENLEMEFIWEEKEKKIIVTNWDNSMAHIFWVGDTQFIRTYAGVQEPMTMEVPPEIVNSRTFLPLRAAEALLGTITWEASTRTVLIESDAHHKKPWEEAAPVF